MTQSFLPGDFLVFQLEAGYGLLRLLAVEELETNVTWHLRAYADLFPDVDSAEGAAAAARLSVSIPHVALTNRAFESTQVSRLINSPLNEEEIASFNEWALGEEQPVSDLSIRLLLGLR